MCEARASRRLSRGKFDFSAKGDRDWLVGRRRDGNDEKQRKIFVFIVLYFQVLFCRTVDGKKLN